LWRPSTVFSADYSVDVSNDKTTPYYVQLLAAGTLKLAPLITLQPDRADRANVGVPLAWSVGKTYGHGLNLDWKAASHLEVKSITSYRHLTQTQFDNGEENNSVFTPNGTFSRYSLADFYQHQYSEELQLIGDVPQVSYVGGAFYYHENVRDDAWTPNTLRWNATGTDYTVLPVPLAATPFPDRASTAITSSTAVFGQATWTPSILDEILHLTAGGRYSHDKKTGSLYLVNGATPTVNGVTAPLPLDKSWNRFDPLVTLSADVTHDISVYGRWGTGYKAGGANSRSLTYRAFNPESVSTFELGGKTEFLDHHARLNVAAYTGTYKDVQIDFSAIIPGANRGTVETTNASGTGRIKGVESDFALTPFNGLTLSASYAFADIKLPQAPNPFVAGSPLVTVYPIYTPKHAGSVGIDYTPAAVTPKLTVHVDGNYATRQYTMTTDPTLSDKGFIVNGRLTLGEIPLNSATGLQVSLWSRNLFDEAHTFVKNFNAALGRYGIFNEPRTFGIDGTVRF
jgi:iron complex outermembrane receptor protein